ncbi:MAG: hypothetical protein MUF75_03385 [Bacteroidia bacterium]|jgi:hypothetical protein|nr:hypothetical protein [Bacteroidia bacterium]
MKTKLFAFITIVAFLFILSCRKDSLNTRVHPVGRTNLKQILQKDYNIGSNEVDEVIKSFKSKFNANTNSMQNRLIEADSVSLDSAIWVLEAALNYDFDVPFDENYETFEDSIEIAVAINDESLKLHSDDLENLYLDFTDSIMNSINDSIKIKLVDVTGYLYVPGSSVALIRVFTSFMNTNVTRPCSGITTYSSPNKLFFNGTLGCSGVPSIDAPNFITSILNCSSYIGNCSNGGEIYYINVNTYNPPYTYALSNALFYASAPLTGMLSHCNQSYANPGLSATTVNNYITNIQSLISNNLPSGKQYYHGNVSCMTTWNSFNSNWIVKWDLKAKYGVPTCRTPID